MGLKYGIDGKLYRNSGSYGTPTWVEVTNCKDLSTDIDFAEFDVTTRGNAGWEAVVAALIKSGVEFEMVDDTADASYTAINTAALARTSIEFAVMNAGILVAGSQGLRATMAILKWARSEKNTEAQMRSVMIKPTYSANAPSWMTVSA